MRSSTVALLCVAICGLVVVQGSTISDSLSLYEQELMSNEMSVLNGAPKSCEINVFLLVDVSGSIKTHNLVKSLGTVLQLLSVVTLRRGGRLTVTMFSKDASTVDKLQVSFPDPTSAEAPTPVEVATKGIRTNAQSAVAIAKAIKAHVTQTIHGNTNIIKGFSEVYKQVQSSPDKDQNNLVYVLSDGSPNELLPGETRKTKPQTADMIGASDFSKLFADTEKTRLAFVLFGKAAEQPQNYKLTPFFSKYGKVLPVKNMEDYKGRQAVLQQLTDGGCADPQWASIFFENNSDNVYDYSADKNSIQTKYNAYWKAQAGGCTTEKPGDFFIAGFASALGDAAKNKLLSERRVKNTMCALIGVLLKKKCFHYTVQTGSFGETYAGKRASASLEDQKADRRTNVYYGKTFIPDFEKFQDGLSHTYNSRSDEFKTFRDDCKARMPALFGTASSTKTSNKQQTVNPSFL
jgi:outer membrane protein OmpA-like peptidoglycan-associated protein